MAISQQLQEIYAGTSSARYIETLQVSHPKFSQIFYLHNDATSAVWNFNLDASATGPVLQDFEAIPFQVNLPASDGNFLQDLQVAIANIGDRIMNELEAAITSPEFPIEIIYRVYLDTPGSDPQIDPPLALTVANISADADIVTAVAQRFDVLNRRFPTELYTLYEFPGLDR